MCIIGMQRKVLISTICLALRWPRRRWERGQNRATDGAGVFQEQQVMSTAAETAAPQLPRRARRAVRTPLDADGRELDKTPDGEHFVDPNTGVAFTQNALKKYCKWQERVADAAARAETRAKKAAETDAAPALAPAVGLAEQHADVVAALEELEKQLRLRHRPALDIRVPVSAAVVARQRSFRAARRVAAAYFQSFGRFSVAFSPVTGAFWKLG